MLCGACIIMARQHCLTDYYSKIASADLEAHGPLPSAIDNQEYYFYRMDQRVAAAFFNQWIAQHSDQYSVPQPLRPQPLYP